MLKKMSLEKGSTLFTPQKMLNYPGADGVLELLLSLVPGFKYITTSYIWVLSAAIIVRGQPKIKF